MNNVIENDGKIAGADVSLHPIPEFLEEGDAVFLPEITEVVRNFPDVLQRIEILTHGPAIEDLEIEIAELLGRKSFERAERQVFVTGIDDWVEAFFFFQDPHKRAEVVVVIHEKRLKILVHEVGYVDQAGINGILGPVEFANEDLIGGSDKADRNNHAKPSLNLVILTNGKRSYNGLMLQKCLLFVLFLLGSTEIFGQDERYYRQILTGELPVTAEPRENFVRNYLVKGSEYLVDLDSDGIEEVIQPEKRDGIDYLNILNSSRANVFSAKLFSSGGDSHIYKIRMVYLTPRIRTLIIFLDEGATKGLRFESTARIYLLSYEDNKLSSMVLNPGPHIFHEKEAQRDQYYRRNFVVDVRDLNQDAKREIIVHFGHIQYIYEYLGSGEWRKY